MRDIDISDKTDTGLYPRIARLETLSEVTSTQLDKIETKVDVLTSEFRGFKDQVLETQLSSLRSEHSAKLKTVAAQTEVNAKVKFLWTAIGVVIAAAIAAILRAYFASGG